MSRALWVTAALLALAATAVSGRRGRAAEEEATAIAATQGLLGVDRDMTLSMDVEQTVFELGEDVQARAELGEAMSAGASPTLGNATANGTSANETSTKGATDATPCDDKEKSAEESNKEKTKAIEKAMSSMGIKPGPNHTNATNRLAAENDKANKELDGFLTNATGGHQNQSSNGTGNATGGAADGNMTIDIITRGNMTGGKKDNATGAMKGNASNDDGILTNSTKPLSAAKEAAAANATKQKQAKQAAAMKAMGLTKNDLQPKDPECKNKTNSTNATATVVAAKAKKEQETKEEAAADDSGKESSLPTKLIGAYTELTGDKGNGQSDTEISQRLDITELSEAL